MITVKKEMTIAGLSELRTRSEAILKQLKGHDVILEKHNKPVAVIVDYKRYALEEEARELAEDYILGTLAMKRDRSAKNKDFVPIEKW
ncbi:MAG: type II toxin-antitoxin system Phd/YefM family antitoxin [Candidatus Omnitrophica bacterium]|nr:type II toxin-antitoxin system Phd/YefM family antitoxin [Candidatus Omnitrophota bacterium]